jgi:N-acetylglucosamine-6-phosphate deacetylase
MSLLLRNARLVRPQGPAAPADLLIKGDRIERILDSSTESNSSTQVIDLDGLALYPGFIDAHIHGAAGVDTMDASAEDLTSVGEFLARNGVTAWLPTLVPAAREQYQNAIDAISELVREDWERGRPARFISEKDPRQENEDRDIPEELRAGRPRSQILGVHYEGPFVNSEQCGALHREHFKTFKDAADLNELPTIDQHDAIHMITLAPEIEGGIELIKELRKRNWIISIGHTRANAKVLDQALTAGAGHMTHFMNAMTPLHHRDIGAVGWGLTHDDVTCDLIADGIHIDRSILKFIAKTKSTERVSLISDAIAAAGLGDGDYKIWGEQINVTNGRTQNDRGSIAGSVITMLDAVRMMLSLGFSESEVARMASLNPARLLGIDFDYGSIDEGKRADLVALDKNQNVRLTIIGGEVCHEA